MTLVIADPREALENSLILGGKAANLARLEALGLSVPPWYAITIRAFHEAVKGIQVAEIASVPIPPELEQEVMRAHALRIPGDDAYVAVRSSAAGEDAMGESFAGLHDSFLYIKGWDRLFDAIRRVWASAYNERVLAYRRAKGISLDNIAVAVVVQRMVDAHAAGVLFTANPNDGNVYEAVVSSLWGAGEGLVSVGLDADTFTVDKETLEIREQIVVKTERMVLNEAAGGGLLRTEVPSDMREAPSLTHDQVKELVTAGLDLERRFRRPQDIEFAVDRAGKLFLLQARPVTTVEELGPAAGHRLLWDNSNIIESYSGVTSPMTFSFIRRAYSIVYHCFAEVMGIDAPTVRANRDVFDNMLGLFRGQVYYNLFNWYRLVRLFPGFNYNKAFMESMMGVREGLQEEPAAVTGVQRYTRELPALLRLVGRSTLNFLRIRTIVSDFQAHFREHYERWSALDFRTMAPHELGALYREMEDKLLWQWKAPIINDFFVMVFYGTLKKLCANWCGDEAGSLQNDLIVGEGGIESTEPTRMLLRLAAQAREMPELRQLLLERSPEDLVGEVPSRFPDFGAEIRRYLDLYGFRGVNELKLEEPSVKDRPAFVYQILRNYITGDPSALDLSVIGEREQRIRREAEARAFEAIRRKGGLLPRAAIFRRVLNNARLGVKNRENMRFARTRIYGVLREILRAVGEHFAAEGLLDAPQDIFYLTLDEVWDYTRGRAVTTNLKALAALRREEFDAYRREADRMPADRFETWGLPYHRNRFQGRPRPAIVSEDGLLRGIGCSPGVVTKPVKVIRTPSEDARLEGEILVAERTDPGWVPLYPSVSGLLIERGSILSHSAIVAREMGIPTIVGILGLTSTLQTGQVVTMDGAAGTVKLDESA
ncbi:MAG TPA: PEP/pyruvate-binding domain-containing protein [Thermoanaerobaculia bacterium]|jgi:pyruvate,water dikinase|nr:PEP/pyruvate-binding domain-containing protein [Thermoanaerobaculia bacterium]